MLIFGNLLDLSEWIQSSVSTQEVVPIHTHSRVIEKGCSNQFNEPRFLTSVADEAWVHVQQQYFRFISTIAFYSKFEIRTSRSLAVIHCLSTIDTCECTRNGKSSNLLWFRLRQYLRNSNINRHVSIWLFITRWWLTWVWNDLWRYLFCFSSIFLKNLAKNRFAGFEQCK